MEVYRGGNDVPGRFPELGAIFMSNKATRKECFRRKLLGLPLAQAGFVKQVRAGMILFLFEFERRELHGVFQACSDGAINIVPHAYSSSGKQFPAQVKFIQIWECDPLSENEFRDAIRENYFSSHKFNFGLSDRQVHKLLTLFSERKVRDRPLERQYTRSKDARSIGYSAKEARSATGKGSFSMIDSKRDEQNANATFGTAISTEYLGDSIRKREREKERYASPTFRNGRHKIDRLIEQFVDSLSKVGSSADDGRAETSNMLGNDHEVDIEHRMDVSTNSWAGTSNMLGNDHEVDIEHRMDVSTNQHGHYFPSSRRSSDDVNFAMSYGLGHEGNEDSYFQFPAAERPGSHFCKPILEESSLMSDHFKQSSAARQLGELPNSPYCSQPILEAVKDQFRLSSTACHLMEPQNSKLSFSALNGDRCPMSNDFCSISHGDGAVAHKIPYDPDLPRLGNGCSSSLDLSNSVPEFPAFQNSGFLSFDQSMPPHVEPEGTRSYRNINSPLPDYIPLSYDNQHEHPNTSGMLFPGGDYPGNVTMNSSMNANPGHDRSLPSFELCNSVPQCLPHNDFPSHKKPRSTSNWLNINSSISSDSPLSYPGHHDRENRTSILFPSAACPENVPRNSPGSERAREDTSSCSRTLNRSSSFVSDVRNSVSSQDERDHLISQQENNEIFAACVPRLERVNAAHVDCLENGPIKLDTCRSSERMYSDCQKRKSVFSRLALPSEVCEQDENDIDSSVDEVMTMLQQSRKQWVKDKNFKQQVRRQGEVTNFKNKKQMTTNSPLLMDHLPKDSKEITMNDISAGVEDDLQISEVIPFVDFQRRRKLQNIQSDANAGDVSGNTGNAGLSGQQHKRRKLIRPKFSGNGTSVNDIVGSQDNGSRMTQNAELPDVTFCTDLEDKTIRFQGCSKYEGKELVESCVVSSSDADGVSKEALQHVGPVSSENPSNVENSSSFTNSEVDGLPRQHGNSNHSVLQDSFSKSYKVKSENGIAKHGLDHDGGNGNLSNNVEAEHISCPEEGNENFSKTVEVENRLCPTSGESAIGIMVSCRPDGPEKASKEIGNGEESKQQLFLPSVGEQCKTSVETASCFNMEKSQEICEKYDKPGEVMTAAAGKTVKWILNEKKVTMG